jgi:broad specificity phosphatase PhoE
MQDGDGELNWVDAVLTKTGEQQAQTAHDPLSAVLFSFNLSFPYGINCENSINNTSSKE